MSDSGRDVRPSGVLGAATAALVSDVMLCGRDGDSGSDAVRTGGGGGSRDVPNAVACSDRSGNAPDPRPDRIGDDASVGMAADMDPRRGATSTVAIVDDAVMDGVADGVTSDIGTASGAKRVGANPSRRAALVGVTCVATAAEKAAKRPDTVPGARAGSAMEPRRGPPSTPTFGLSSAAATHGRVTEDSGVLR